jgi:hypothetical protein
MAKATITFVDKADGGYRMRVVFKPDLVSGQNMTQAQNAAYLIAKSLAQGSAPEAFKVLDGKFPGPGEAET